MLFFCNYLEKNVNYIKNKIFIVKNIIFYYLIPYLDSCDDG